jgi:hypothetical protein
MVLRFASRTGATILVGQTAAENDQLCAAADGDDVWFHLEGTSSPHVILHGHGVTPEAIADGRQLCKLYSKHKHSTRAHVIHLPVRHVRKVRTDATGTVRLTAEPTAQIVATDPQAVERLLATKQRVRSQGSLDDAPQQHLVATASKRERKAARKAEHHCKRRARCGSTALSSREVNAIM